MTYEERAEDAWEDLCNSTTTIEKELTQEELFLLWETYINVVEDYRLYFGKPARRPRLRAASS
jgi:hypothetical protein